MTHNDEQHDLYIERTMYDKRPKRSIVQGRKNLPTSQEIQNAFSKIADEIVKNYNSKRKEQE